MIQRFCLRLALASNDGKDRKANYMVNVNELKNWVDITDEDDDDDID